MIVLLGPVGAGKTAALDAVERDMSWGVVHARYDFGAERTAGTGVPATNEILIRLVYALSQRWRNRRKPGFLRFSIALIAISATLEHKNRDADRARLSAFVDEFHAALGETAVQAVVNRVADAAETAELLDPSLIDLIRRLFPVVVRPVRRQLRRAMKDLADFPQTQGGDVLDALVALNGLSAVQQTERLLLAFLGDIRENHRRMARPERGGPCKCADGTQGKHVHNWVALLDDIHLPGGQQFLADLDNAREQLPHGTHDPLLVIATSGRWSDEFTEWLPPWRHAGTDDGLRPLTTLRKAGYGDWENASSKFYPLSLDPLKPDDIAEILRADRESSEVKFVVRATNGLPLAVTYLAMHLRDRSVEPGARDVLGVDQAPYPRLAALRLTGHVDGVSIEDFVTATPFATAPWLIPVSTEGRADQPLVGVILTELRTSLWVAALSDAQAITPNRAVLHPWVEMNLVAALSRRDGGQPTYVDQFTLLRDDPDTRNDPVRRAYGMCALGQIAEVVAFFDEQFDKIPHRAWLERFLLVVRAPNALPPTAGCLASHDEVVMVATAADPAGTEVRNSIARLVAAGWLLQDRSSAREPALDSVIVAALTHLANNSRQGDIQPLQKAIDLAKRGRLIGD
ncbi:hypothetical protein [Kibdelosporangium phytohabitans]|uniref:Uncharacterized protein n=1 Tax=Kibdelosporangium phytohabitans TaxID=860235 RepID=A0A0N9HUA2_9PSEU|nr:hypothetical protein [Kibdelosporangium phytohabitans]ALG08789.1 hypothetical protein AOZ06_19385 [Kibdelosporangium phytohabitans]MBE1470081.1 hypothetical protein [Kibdelosporangium phytohabitans]